MQNPWRATGFYGHPNASKRPTSWQLLEALKNQCTMPWIVFGDFNEITHQHEKLGWKERELNQMEGFRESLSKCGLFDLGFVGQRFTWCNERFGEQRTLLRLDRMVANSSWSELYPEARVYHRSMSSSDHCLLYLSLKNILPRKHVKKRFQFEAMWVREEGCKEVVEGAWDPYRGGLGYSIMDRLKRCQVSLQSWNWSVFWNVNRVLKQKQERLQFLEGLNCLHEKAEEIKGLRMEINEMLTREEIMWNQRSRASWIKLGDRNTKFFHATASQRRRRNKMVGIQGADGMWQEKQEDIESTILIYFESIFKTDHPPQFGTSLGAIDQRVTRDMNESLVAEFKAEEVWRALIQMHPTKAPGPDGMSPMFYQQYWEIVGPEVIKCVLDSLNTGVLPCGINDTYICLIPKMKSPQKITEYRLISLCNVLYKLISKVLANRLKNILVEIIDGSQSAFVPGRLISNNVLVAFEMMHSIDQRRKGKEAFMAVKLDMSKAYDRVEWAYL